MRDKHNRARQILDTLLSRGFRVTITPDPSLSGKDVVLVLGDPGLSTTRQVIKYQAEIISLLKQRAKAANHLHAAEWRMK